MTDRDLDLDGDGPGCALAVLISIGFVLAVGLGLVVLIAWAGYRDEAGMTRVETVATTSTTRATTTTSTTLDPDRGWPADWLSEREIGLIAWSLHLDHLAEAEPEPVPEVDASSMAIEQTPSGEIVVTNPPEAPIEAVPEGELEALICSYDWDCGTALRVAACESTMNPGAISPGGDMGLMQVNPVHRGRVADMGYEWEHLLDPAVNLEVAWSIYADAGHSWRPWSCARGLG